MVKNVSIDIVDAFFERSRVRENRLTNHQFAICIQWFDDSGRVTRGNDIRGDIRSDKASGADYTIFSNGHALVHGGAIADPNVVAKHHRFCLTHGLCSVINIVPVGICDVGTGCRLARCL